MSTIVYVVSRQGETRGDFGVCGVFESEEDARSYVTVTKRFLANRDVTTDRFRVSEHEIQKP